MTKAPEGTKAQWLKDNQDETRVENQIRCSTWWCPAEDLVQVALDYSCRGRWILGRD